jgi:hypothetical protein
VAKKRKIDPAFESCARCGYMRKSHALANFADGPMIGAPVLICPFATWKPPLASAAVDPQGRSEGKRSTRV